VSVEEIGSEPPRPRRRGSGGVIVGIVVAVGVGWVLLHGGGDSTATSGPTPSASQPSPSESPTEAQRPGIADAQFELGEVCAPLPAAKKTFDVRFTLVNPSPADLLLLRVVPSLPLGGLVLEETQLTLGGCEGGDRPSQSQSQLRVPARGSVLVVFRFHLPETCPSALPVQADVTSRVFNVSQSGQRIVLPIYPDLGSLDFATCQ
jgi:hypothetical protein